MTDRYRPPFQRAKLLPALCPHLAIDNKNLSLNILSVIAEFCGKNTNGTKNLSLNILSVPDRFSPLRFGYTKRLGNHRAATDDVNQDERMKHERADENFTAE